MKNYFVGPFGLQQFLSRCDALAIVIHDQFTSTDELPKSTKRDNIFIAVSRKMKRTEKVAQRRPEAKHLFRVTYDDAVAKSLNVPLEEMNSYHFAQCGIRFEELINGRWSYKSFRQVKHMASKAEMPQQETIDRLLNRLLGKDTNHNAEDLTKV